MFRSKVTSLILAVVLIGVMCVSVAETQAGWRHWGGGWGCCGYSSYGGWYAPVGWYSSYGWGYPSYGYGYGYGYGWRGCGWRGCGWRGCGWSSCYSPCYYTSCCYDTCCSGTVVSPATPSIQGDQTPTPAPAPAPNPNAPADTQPYTPQLPADTGAADSQTRTTISADAGLLTIRVPENAAVFINGYRTKSTGTTRQYISNGLKPGLSYKYEVRAETVRDGRLVEDSQVVYLTAGNSERVAFSFDSNSEQRLATIW